MISKSLSFGIQNYFIVAQDETALDYNYYGYVEKKGSTLLMRTNKTATEIRYFVSPETFATIWAIKATKAYTTPDQLTDPKV
jgi:Asp-tRNA(Asn)/Glu-tRNA(Gln) amidotransferase B subunit